MKVCNNCELPITCTTNNITSAWKLINNQDYTAKVDKLNPNSIRVKLESSVFTLKITKKPNREEFKTIVKVSGLGIIIIGLLGFIIQIIRQLLF